MRFSTARIAHGTDNGNSAGRFGEKYCVKKEGGRGFGVGLDTLWLEFGTPKDMLNAPLMDVR